MHADFLTEAMEPLLRWLNVTGLAVFAVSGALAAARKRLDLIGACFFAVITATGGGTLRDLLIGAPVFWMTDAVPVVICIVVAMVSWVVPLRFWPGRALEWLDAAGLAAYAVYGAAKALQYGITPISAAAMGIVTACLGGVIRDIVAGVPSILLRHELYVSAALVAAGLFVGLTGANVPPPSPMVIGAVTGFALRGAALHWNLSLPPHPG